MSDLRIQQSKRATAGGVGAVSGGSPTTRPDRTSTSGAVSGGSPTTRPDKTSTSDALSAHKMNSASPSAPDSSQRVQSGTVQGADPFQSRSDVIEHILNTGPARRLAFASLSAGAAVPTGALKALRSAHRRLESATQDGNVRLASGAQFEIASEQHGLARDVHFIEAMRQGGSVEHARQVLIKKLGATDEVARLERALGGGPFAVTLADRDGTLVPYAARYATTIESVLTALGAKALHQRSGDAVILSAGPLEQMAALALRPSVTFAGSKGREYQCLDGEIVRKPLPKSAKVLAAIARDVRASLKNDAELATLLHVGSGFQEKHGELTIAYQDVADSVPADVSRRIRERVRELVAHHDSAGALAVHETGLDMEVVMRLEGKAFDKADGVSVLDSDLQLFSRNPKGPILVLGDTSSDLALLDGVRAHAPDREIKTVFVTENEGLRAKVRERVADAEFATHPDHLNLALLAGVRV